MIVSLLQNLEVDIPTALLYLSANTIIANVSNGVSPYTYTMFGPNNYSSTFISNGGGEVFYPTTTGIYSVTATDAVGCSITDTFSIGQIIYGCMDVLVSNLSDLSVITDLLGREIEFDKVLSKTTLFYLYENSICETSYIDKLLLSFLICLTSSFLDILPVLVDLKFSLPNVYLKLIPIDVNQTCTSQMIA